MKINRLTIAACALLGAGVMVEVCGCKEEKPQPQAAHISQLPSERTIGTIEPVTEFYDAMPTGVTVSRDARVNSALCEAHDGIATDTAAASCDKRDFRC